MGDIDIGGCAHFAAGDHHPLRRAPVGGGEAQYRGRDAERGGVGAGGGDSHIGAIDGARPQHHRIRRLAAAVLHGQAERGDGDRRRGVVEHPHRHRGRGGGIAEIVLHRVGDIDHGGADRRTAGDGDFLRAIPVERGEGQRRRGEAERGRVAVAGAHGHIGVIGWARIQHDRIHRLATALLHRQALRGDGDPRRHVVIADQHHHRGRGRGRGEPGAAQGVGDGCFGVAVLEIALLRGHRHRLRHIPSHRGEGERVIRRERDHFPHEGVGGHRHHPARLGTQADGVSAGVAFEHRQAARGNHRFRRGVVIGDIDRDRLDIAGRPGGGEAVLDGGDMVFNVVVIFSRAHRHGAHRPPVGGGEHLLAGRRQGHAAAVVVPEGRRDSGVVCRFFQHLDGVDFALAFGDVQRARANRNIGHRRGFVVDVDRDLRVGGAVVLLVAPAAHRHRVGDERALVGDVQIDGGADIDRLCGVPVVAPEDQSRGGAAGEGQAVVAGFNGRLHPHRLPGRRARAERHAVSRRRPLEYSQHGDARLDGDFVIVDDDHSGAVVRAPEIAEAEFTRFVLVGVSYVERKILAPQFIHLAVVDVGEGDRNATVLGAEFVVPYGSMPAYAQPGQELDVLTDRAVIDPSARAAGHLVEVHHRRHAGYRDAAGIGYRVGSVLGEAPRLIAARLDEGHPNIERLPFIEGEGGLFKADEI